MSTERLFFAVLPDAPTRVRIAALASSLRDAHALHGTPIPSTRLHATVQFLGTFTDGVADDVLDRARRAGAAVRADAFDLTFDRAQSFTRRATRRPLVLLASDGAPALVALHRRLGESLAAAGWTAPLDHTLTPHVTLLYDDIAVPDTPVPPIGWRVAAMYLVRSHAGGGEHEMLASWPFA